MYPASAGPQYVPGGSANAAVCFLVICWALVLRLCQKWENEKLEKIEREGLAVDDDNTRAKGFRYVL